MRNAKPGGWIVEILCRKVSVDAMAVDLHQSISMNYPTLEFSRLLPAGTLLHLDLSILRSGRCAISSIRRKSAGSTRTWPGPELIDVKDAATVVIGPLTICTTKLVALGRHIVNKQPQQGRASPLSVQSVESDQQSSAELPRHERSPLLSSPPSPAAPSSEPHDTVRLAKSPWVHSQQQDLIQRSQAFGSVGTRGQYSSVVAFQMD